MIRTDYGWVYHSKHCNSSHLTISTKSTLFLSSIGVLFRILHRTFYQCVKLVIKIFVCVNLGGFFPFFPSFYLPLVASCKSLGLQGVWYNWVPPPTHTRSPTQFTPQAPCFLSLLLSQTEIGSEIATHNLLIGKGLNNSKNSSFQIWPQYFLKSFNVSTSVLNWCF